MTSSRPGPTNSAATASGARRLAMLGYVVLALGAAAYWLNSPWQSPVLNLLAIAICLMGIRPILRWLQRNDQAYPLLEVLLLTMVPFYAVPLLTEHEAVAAYPESVLTQAAWLVLLFQIACALGGRWADGPANSPAPGAVWWTDELIAEKNLRFTGYTLMLTTVYLFISNFTQLIPSELVGTLRAVFFGIGIISGFIQARLWGSGLLHRSQQTALVVNIVLQILLANLGLLLVTGLIILLLVLVGYFSTARRVPLVVCVIALPLFAVLHSGKHKMREIYWGDQGRAVGLAEVPAFYEQWINYGLESGIKIAGREDSSGHSSLFERASLFQIVCYTMDTVPARSSFLEGETYSYILPQVVPRFLWPGKPSPNDSVKLLSVKLGLLTEQEAETTSIGYGLLAESYANFGYYGSVILAMLLGFVARKIARTTAACSTLSVGGIFRILCLAWALNTETTLAVWLSSLYQACIAIVVPLLAYHSLMGDRDPPP